MIFHRSALASVALLLLAAVASPDVVVLTNGTKIRGGYAEVGGDVIVNPFNSRHPEMVWKVESHPRSAVKELIREDPPLVDLLRRWKALGPRDLDGRMELADRCKEHRMKEERELLLVDVLRLDPDHEGAIKALGSSRHRKLAKGNPDLDPEVRAAIDAYLENRDPDERKAAHGRLKREHAVSLPQEYLDRMIRSRARPTGRHEDVPLTLGSKESPGVYTIVVPKAYDSRRAWPLIIGLHGGGRGGKDGKEVVGSGPSAMNFYERQAQNRGYIVVCPTALEAPWGATPNRAFLRHLIDEIELLYNVDLNRVYLTGHSMGGFGTWQLGPHFAEELAAVSPMAGGGGPNSTFVKTSTPVFIYHGADDGVVGPGGDRAAAGAWAGSGFDFVYTELTGVGHGFPPSIQEDLFDFFDLRRLATGRGRKTPSAAVRSSFLVKVSREEKRYLGDPTEYGEAGGGGQAEWKALLRDLTLGGGSAEAAATRLGELKAEDSVKPVGDLLRSSRTADDVKVHAARALGLIGHEDGYAGLFSGLRSENHELVTESAKAMAAIRAPKSGDALVGALPRVVKILEGKRMGERIHISDWTPWMGALEETVRGIGVLGVEGGTEAIRRTAVRSVFGQTWAVLYSERVRMDPWGPRLRLARAICEAALAIGGDAARPTIEAVKAGPADPRDELAAEVRRACDEALARLPE